MRTVSLDAGDAFHTAYKHAFWPQVFNPSGAGDTRFAPLKDAHGNVVPTLYGAARQAVALLETAFHEVHADGARLISEALDLAPRGLATLTCPTRFTLFDLRDAGLARLGLDRAQLVATSAEHYPCTREWARHLHGRRVGRARPVGLMWRSRVAELARADSPLLNDFLTGAGADVFVLFGDGAPTDAAQYHVDEVFADLTDPGGDGRILAEEIATLLGATIVTA